MIYPDVSLTAWLKRFTELTIETGNCNKCGKNLRSTIPIIDAGYVGVVSPKCSCGMNTNQVMVITPTSIKEIEYWNSLLL